MKRFATLTIALLLGGAACSGDASKDQNDNNGWELGDDAGNNASDAGNNTANNANNTPANNTPTNNGSNNASANNTTPPVNNTTAPTNNATSNNTTGPTNNNTMGNGAGVEGDACAVNSDCGGSLTCCQGFDGNATCQPMCLGGGLCGGNDDECTGNEVCCEFSQLNQPDSCVAPNFCRNNNGGGNGMACMTNSDCTAPEVCCLGFDGSGECTTDCFTGGACNDDAECLNGQLCCDINVAKICLDQCSF